MINIQSLNFGMDPNRGYWVMGHVSTLAYHMLNKISYSEIARGVSATKDTNMN